MDSIELKLNAIEQMLKTITTILIPPVLYQPPYNPQIDNLGFKDPNINIVVEQTECPQDQPPQDSS